MSKRQNNGKITALYERLSHDDERSAPSKSLSRPSIGNA